MGRLDDKVCIVTGAGSRGAGVGTGRAASMVFAREGGKVLLVDRSEQAVEVTRRMIADDGGTCETFVGDMTSADDIRAMVAYAGERYGRIDVLDNNLGIHGPGTILDVSEEDWSQVLRVNVTSMMLVSREVVPVMAANGGGAIVNLSSISALRPRGLTPYSTSKGAVIALTQAMAVDHAAAGIRVNCIAPGPIYTPMVAADGMSDELRARRRSASLLGIEGTAYDVANAALYLVSDEARYVTGVVLPVDGGTTLRGPGR
jgi:NAD(P)-dependent dehydrogenase (short-subunit alcohol dehydrogenase family)